jgi:hypothetical protein
MSALADRRQPTDAARVRQPADLAVLAIIAIAAYKLARTTNKGDPLLWAIAAAVCAVTAISKPAHHQARAAPARATD